MSKVLTEEEIRERLFIATKNTKRLMTILMKEGMTVLGTITAITNPIGSLLIGSISQTTHRAFSALSPKEAHPDIYKELDKLKEDIELLKRRNEHVQS